MTETAKRAARAEHQAMLTRHADDMDWETIRWPGQLGKMMFHPSPERPTEPNAGLVRYDAGSHHPAHRHVDAAEIERRQAAYHRPYHHAIREALDEIVAAGHTPVLVSIPTFPPQFKGRPLRPWHVGLLWDRDDRLLKPLLARLRTQPDLVVGDNEPYTGQLVGDCMWQHGTQRGFPHVLIEIRNDLIEGPDQQADWAARLAPMIRGAVEDLTYDDLCLASGLAAHRTGTPPAMELAR